MSNNDRTFNTSTLKGLKQAERFKTRLENKYDRVTTTPIGLNRVRITGEYLESYMPGSGISLRDE